MTRTGEQRVQKGSKRRSNNGPAAFKYYIHDTALGYSLEMSGPFTGLSVAELNCCWQTAKTTLKDRSVTLDLRGITAVDESAKQWLASMTQEGAKSLPDTFLRDVLAGLPDGEEDVEKVRRSFLGRLSSAIRGFA